MWSRRQLKVRKSVRCSLSLVRVLDPWAEHRRGAERAQADEERKQTKLTANISSQASGLFHFVTDRGATGE